MDKHKILTDLNEVILKHDILWHVALQLIAENAFEQCVAESDEKVVQAFTDAGNYLKKASEVLEKSVLVQDYAEYRKGQDGYQG